MIVKVSGMREPENIRAVARLGADMIGMVFIPGSDRYVRMTSSRAGIIPDYGEDVYTGGADETRNLPVLAGVFADDMPQNIITRIYNYGLGCVQLDGGERPVMIDNLRRTVDPDIRRGLKVIKTVSVETEADMKRWREYSRHADMLLFRGSGGTDGGRFPWRWLDAYDGDLPFLLGGGIGPDDADEVRKISHPMFAGVDLDSRFETSPGVKDVTKIKEFIDSV